VDPQTATIKVRLLFPNPTNYLRTGMSANLKVLNNSGAETILIPYRAVVEQMAEYFVFVVNADTVTQKKISIGQQIRDMVVVKSGLEENETIVLDGVQKLRNGAKVKVAAPSSPGADSTGRPKADSSKRKSS
jgi:membrane fusion protein (multidrug efflux system)